MERPLLGKISLVSLGDFSPVCASVAKRFAANGSNVILLHTASSRSCAQLVAKAVNAQKAGIALLAEVDFSALCSSSGVPDRIDGGSVNNRLDETLRVFGKIDILVHADDAIRGRQLSDIDDEFFEEMTRSHVKEPFFLTKFVAPHMKEGGRVIFFSSFITRATSPLPKGLLYAGCKGAIEQVTRVLAKDLGRRGITVNAVSLGPVDTPIFRAGKTPEELRKIATLSPGRRLAFVDEIVPTIVFLATPEAAWVNGQIVAVNGGYVV